MNEQELNQEREYWAGMIEQATTKLPVFRSMLTNQIIKVVTDRTDRDRAVHLSKRVFDIEYRQKSPEDYAAGMKELNEILARYGVNYTAG